MAAQGIACKLDAKIDELGGVSSVAELIPAIQDILHEMAYYVGASDGAILDAQESWRGEYTDRLRSAVGQDSKRATQDAKRPMTAAAPAPQVPNAGSKPPSAAGRGAKAKPALGRAKPALGRAKPVDRPAEKAPNIPASLQAILTGAHPSFRDADD